MLESKIYFVTTIRDLNICPDLFSEVSLFQGENNSSRDLVKYPDYPGVVISGMPFKRGSTVRM